MIEWWMLDDVGGSSLDLKPNGPMMRQIMYVAQLLSIFSASSTATLRLYTHTLEKCVLN